MGMKFFMCANRAHDPPESSLLFYRAPVRLKFHEMTYLLVFYLDVLVTLFLLQSPSPLCQWYHWIDTEQPEWALRQIEERQRRAWERFQEEERQEEEAAQRKAAQEAYNEEKRRRIAEGKRRREAEEERRKQIRESERERKKERAAQAEAAEKRGDTTGKWPRWTQD
jgi:hypothetical protein